jgi:hypothetical protein
MVIQSPQYFGKKASVPMITAMLIITSFVVSANFQEKETMAISDKSVSPIYLYQGFEGSWPPSGWSVDDLFLQTEYSFFGEYAAKFYDPAGSATAEISRVFAMDDYSTYLGFWYKLPGSENNHDTLTIQYANWLFPDQWFDLSTFSSYTPAYTRAFIEIPDEYFTFWIIRFVATSGGGDGVYLDELRVCNGFDTEVVGSCGNVIKVAPLGFATISHTAEGLNIGQLDYLDSGSGVWIDIKDKDVFHCDFEDYDADDALPLETYLVSLSKGKYNNQTDKIISGESWEKIGSREEQLSVFEITDTYTVRVYNNTEIVYYNSNYHPEELPRIHKGFEPPDWWKAVCSGVKAGVDFVLDRKVVKTVALDGDGEAIYDNQGNPVYNTYKESSFKGSASVETITFKLTDNDNTEIEGTHFEYKANYDSYRGIGFEGFTDYMMYTNNIPEITIIDMYALSNNQPSIPDASGNFIGRINQNYELSLLSTDPDGDSVYYYIDWDDGINEWIGPYSSGQQIVTTHQYSSIGSYNIRVRAMDVHSYETDMVFVPVFIPKHYFQLPLLYRVLELFPNSFPLIRNFLVVE